MHIISNFIHLTTYIFSFVIISSFLSKKKAYAGSFSVSIWRNRLPNRIECLWRPMATMLFRKQRVEIGFAGSMTTILTWVTRSVKIGSGKLRTVNCRLLWMRTIPNCKKCLPNNWVFLKPISMRLHAMEKIQKIGKWLPHELNRQMERRQNTCWILLARQKRKSFLHRIVTGDEQWIYFQNSKRKKSWVDPAQPSTSSFQPNRFGRKTMLCVWWD